MKQMKQGVLLLTAVLLIVPMAWGLCQSSPGVKSVVEVIHLGSEKPGVRLEEVVLRNGFQPEPTAIRVRQSMSGLPHTIFLLSSLSQLQGLVQIRNTEAALRFVRLRTASQFCYDWFTTDGYAEQEVTIAPAADLTKWSPSGCHAGLSLSAYRRGGFTSPTVEVVAGGYRITRWVCVFKGLKGARVQQWQESVGTDGAYRRIVLKDKPIPRLPKTQWFIFGRQ
jgi:hypothetical protein